MRTVRTVADLRGELTPARREEHTIGLVPTMGALHEGHLELIRRARRDCDVVVVSLFVNPTQFNDAGDLARYPRDEERDAALAAQAGADVLFAPALEEVYPAGFATHVEVAGLTEALEGEHRPGHFRGVTTIVAKLFNMASPQRAYFGQKDAQQALVIRRMVRDLDMPIEVVVVPTVREPDGLALSSRNALLSPQERERAVALSRALDAARTLADDGERDATRLREAAISKLREQSVETEYVAVVDRDTLQPLDRLDGPALVAIAARVGSTRLIDNTLIETGRR